MERCDVAVIGGGPAGYAAALAAAARGASVVLVEAEKPGGACVHHACIPTNVLLAAALTHLEARELALHGLFEVGEQSSLARSAARKDALVARLSAGIAAALRQAKVRLIAARASLSGPHEVAISGGEAFQAEAIVLAAGTRWEPPTLPGFAPERVLTPDAVQRLAEAPASAVVLGDGPAGTAFGLEYATLLALSGSTVTVVTARRSILPALDTSVAAFVRASLEGAGIRVFEEASLTGEGAGGARVAVAGASEPVPAEVVVAADPRRPYFAQLGLAAAGVDTTDCIPVDRRCQTNVAHIFAAGDVTGGAMLTNAATHMGEVAGTNAAGGEARSRLGRLPHLLHTVPETGWIGLTEDAARAEGYDVATGLADLSYNARALALGAREGLVKGVADRELGEILGVHVAGPGASEVLAAAAVAMQAEIGLADLAALVPWHPSVAEGLVEAARRALS